MSKRDVSVGFVSYVVPNKCYWHLFLAKLLKLGNIMFLQIDIKVVLSEFVECLT